jgi:hypothetical protein
VLGIAPEPAATGNMDVRLEERSRMNQLIMQHLFRAQDHMKKQADKKQFEHSFSVGDLVYMKQQPYIQSSVVHRANQKLEFKYFGPFPILQRVGSMVYKLQLSASATIHPVVHVSQLKLATGFKG